MVSLCQFVLMAVGAWVSLRLSYATTLPFPFLVLMAGIITGGIGILIGLFWPAAVVFCAVWLSMAVALRYSSLSALTASVVAPLFLWWFGQPALAALFAVLTLLLIYMHRENIKRLLAGTEGKIGQKA